MKRMYIIIPIIHWFVGIGAVTGGLGAVLNPDNPMVMPLSSLKNGPFQNYLIPGLFLLLIIGLGNITAGIIVRKKMRYHEFISGAMGLILTAWIIIQCLVLWAINWLHVVYFILGVLQGILSLILIWKNEAFPAGILKAILRKTGIGEKQ